jgi:DNA-binding MarR family transcriptional regulator
VAILGEVTPAAGRPAGRPDGSPELDADIDALAGELRTSITRLSRRLRAERGARDLSLVQLSVLGTLRRNGAMSVGDLAAEERSQVQSLTRPVADLERRGLITRRPDTIDGRRVILSITPAGRETIFTDAVQRRAWLAKAIDDKLTRTERDLLHLAAQLLDRLADPDPGPDLDLAAPTPPETTDAR